MNEFKLIDNAMNALFGTPKTKHEKKLNKIASSAYIKMQVDARRKALEGMEEWFKHHISHPATINNNNLETRIERKEHYADK